MADITDNPQDPRLKRGIDDEPVQQNEAYLVLSEDERQQGFVRPLRAMYRHKTCGTVTGMSDEIAATYARDPKFYGATYCVHCRMHRPVSEFIWDDGSEVGS